MINIIHPYKFHGIWVFDDESKGLDHEPFVGEINTMIDALTVDIPNADTGFNLLFSSCEFPGYQHVLGWIGEEQGGNWYYSKLLDKEGWLCPALLKYFAEAPDFIYLQLLPFEQS